VGHAEAAVKPLSSRLLYRGCLLEERAYRRIYRLHAVGELIHLGRARYEGPGRVLADCTRINPGDMLGILHFDNQRLAAIERRPDSPRHRAFVFLRLLRDSLTALAQRVRVDPELKDLASFRGVTWMPGRGRHLGFETEPLPKGLRSSLMRLHFRLILRAFYPETAIQRAQQPYIYWLTRRQLMERFGREDQGTEVPIA
jgi:hypothetical protein